MVDRDAPAGHLAVDILRDPLAPALRTHAVDTVVHLVAQVDPPRRGGREAMRQLHEDGTRRVLAACREAGVSRFVLVSSAVVYGARPHGPSAYTESDPVRPLPALAYAVDKAAQEAIVRGPDADGLDVAIARPAIVYGAGADNYLTHFVRRSPGVLPALDGHTPPLQFVHTADAGDALAALALSGVTGTFNVASAGTVSFEALARLGRMRVVPTPARLVAPALDGLFRALPSVVRTPAGFLDYLRYPFVMDTRAISRATGWHPRYSGLDAAADMLGLTAPTDVRPPRAGV